MKFISHRGNLNGINLLKENHPEQVRAVLKLGIDCEIDVWVTKGKVYLGHDKPKHEISYSFLENKRLWCHAKNIEALIEMSKRPEIHFFWHENDKATITSKGYIWAYPRKDAIKNSIIVLPEIFQTKIKKDCVGICSDEILTYTH